MRTRFSARLDRPWGSHSILHNGYRVFSGRKVRPGLVADHSPPSSAAVMEELSCTSTQLLGHFSPEKDSVPILQEIVCAAGLVWTGGKSRPYRDLIPDCPARSSVGIYRVSGLEVYKNTCLCFSTQKLHAIYVSNSVQSNSKRILCTSVHFNVGTCCSSTDI